MINLGTNDFSLHVPAATFKAKYAAFPRHIRAEEPDAILFAMRPYGGFFEKETQEAVARNSCSRFVISKPQIPQPGREFSEEDKESRSLSSGPTQFKGAGEPGMNPEARFGYESCLGGS